jgi:Kdo2-lipid IVA lauroyltransferase/acyltransferase
LEFTFAKVRNRILKAFVYGIARLPFPVIYALSDFLFFVVYYFLKYRRDVVDDNLRHAFPQYTEKERIKIRKQFFRELADLAMETIKTLTITREELLDRCRMIDNEGSRHYFANPNGTVMLTAHFVNWEWCGNVFGLLTKDRPVQVVFLKIKNRLFNEVMKNIRTRFGNQAVHMEHSFRTIMQQKDLKMVTCFLADQTPQVHQIGHWAMFLNRMTPFFNGPEKIAARLNQAVYYTTIRRTSRGRYEIDMELVTENPANEKPGFVMDEYARRLEAAIRQQPANWLWSHRRWKHSYEKYGQKDNS